MCDFGFIWTIIRQTSPSFNRFFQKHWFIHEHYYCLDMSRKWCYCLFCICFTWRSKNRESIWQYFIKNISWSILTTCLLKCWIWGLVHSQSKFSSTVFTCVLLYKYIKIYILHRCSSYYISRRGTGYGYFKLRGCGAFQWNYVLIVPLSWYHFSVPLSHDLWPKEMMQ